MRADDAAQCFERLQTVDGVQYRVLLLPPDHPGRTEFELALRERGGFLPLPHRLSFSGLLDEEPALFVCVYDHSGAAALGFAVQAGATRALPGHSVWRAVRLGASSDPRALRAAVRTLAERAAIERRVLRLHLEFFMPGSAERDACEAECRALGFRRAVTARSYQDTILIDLTPPPEDIFARFSRSTRRNIRAVDKNPVALRKVTDPALNDRLNVLLGETMARTGASHTPMDWSALIAFCARHPDSALFLGLFDERPGVAEPLVAFGVTYNHGEFAEYATAASTRATDLKVPLAYALVWEAMRWAKSSGATCFDFGGVTRGTLESGDERGGISDFKRFFSPDVAEVGSEWVLEPRPVRAAFARRVSAAARWLSRRLSR